MVINIVSLVGAFLALLAYYMVSVDKWPASQRTYHWVNLISSVVLGCIAVYTGVLGYMLLNGVWGIVAVRSLYKMYRSRVQLNLATE